MKRARYLLFLVLCFPGCGIPESGVKLGVPFRLQETSYFCGPACIQMWRAYDGLQPEYSQASLYSAMGGVGCGGVGAPGIPRAVQLFTYSRDAYLDTELNQAGRVEGFYARQITSIESENPVIMLPPGHAVILNGGKWHRNATTGYYVWDFVYLHDPEVGPDEYYAANEWLNASCPSFECKQVISAAAVRGWEANLSIYGDVVLIPGRPGGGDGPPPV